MSQAPSLSSDTITAMVADDNPIRGKNFNSAIIEFIRQMKVNNVTVAKCNVTASYSSQPGIVGNGIVIATTKRGDGLVQENLVAETALLICTQDSYSGGAVAGQEQFNFIGVQNNANPWDWDWPQGSSANQFVNAISASQYANAQGNLLTNGDFENWNPTSPLTLQNWILNAGSYGTDIIQSQTPFTGIYSVQINPTGNTVQLLQPFGSSSGTPASLTYLTSYAANLWIRAAGPLVGSPIGGLLLTLTQGFPAITGGTVTVQFLDQGVAVTSDAQGVPNSYTFNLNQISGDGMYVAIGNSQSVFRTPYVLPNTTQLSITVSGLTGGAICIDSVAVVQITSAYPGGVGVAIFSGNTNFEINDSYNVVSTNDRAGSIYCATFQAEFDRNFNMRQLGLLLPSSSSPTIPDSLITGSGGQPYGGLLLTLTRP